MLKKILLATAIAANFSLFSFAMEIGFTQDAKQKEDRLVKLPKKQILEAILKKYDLDNLAKETGILEWLSSDGDSSCNNKQINLSSINKIKETLIQRFMIIASAQFDKVIKEISEGSIKELEKEQELAVIKNNQELQKFMRENYSEQNEEIKKQNEEIKKQDEQEIKINQNEQEEKQEAKEKEKQKIKDEKTKKPDKLFIKTKPYNQIDDSCGW